MTSSINRNHDESRQRDEICDIGRSLFGRGLATGSSGNISVRLDDGWLVTPTNSSLGKLDPTRLSRLDASGQLERRSAVERGLPALRNVRGTPEGARDRTSSFDPFRRDLLHGRVGL